MPISMVQRQLREKLARLIYDQLLTFGSWGCFSSVVKTSDTKTEVVIDFTTFEVSVTYKERTDGGQKRPTDSDR
jgi:hypothetical protein